MKKNNYYLIIIFLGFLYSPIYSQNRIQYNNQSLFLSGANLAWVNFANDIGPNQTDYNSFAEAMLLMHDNGGNALRWWLHTNGTNSPEFNDTGLVIGPGQGSIVDLKTVLDLAWEREIGIILCLWSFDMLSTSNDATVLNRNRLMLEDTVFTRAYINKALIPMIDSLKNHPAIIAWEIFNEPEGMSNEFGWGNIQHVPMSVIQRFINLCAGAIHRTDTTALVTSGAWSFLALTDLPAKPPAQAGEDISSLSTGEKEQIMIQFNQKYRMSLTADEVISYLLKIAKAASVNYYTDSRLIAAGGDFDGILDFYSVHYYSGILPSNPTSISPFHYHKNQWGLDKPVVVAEFAMQNTIGVLKENLFDTLYQNGYAGALPWSWSDAAFSSRADMLTGMKFMWDNYRADVDLQGISGDWPQVSIIYPQNYAEFPDSTAITIQAVASDYDGSVISVEFFANDTIKIGQIDTIPYNILWTNIEPGNYVLTAVATDDSRHQRVSNRINIVVGTPPMTRIEETRSIRQGADMSIISSPFASGGTYLDIKTNAASNTITWTLPNVPQTGTYEIRFGYRCFYDSPKEQFININGVRIDTIRFEGNTSSWLEKGTTVGLVEGENTVQMQLYWGWMYLDYLAVPTGIVASISENNELLISYSLDQNYPNPFNPGSTIRYQIPEAGFVELKVFDVLGNEVQTLVRRHQSAGRYDIFFNGSRLASGIYIYRLIVNDFASAKKMMLVK